MLPGTKLNSYMDDSLETPDEGNEADDRVDVQAELGERTACASEDGNKSVYPGDLVEEL